MTLKPGHVAADTNVGLVRECNEDSFGYICGGGAAAALAIVADGIGGHDSGDVASFLCVSEMIVRWKKSRIWCADDDSQIEAFLRNSIIVVNEKIYNLNSAFSVEHPMGTTVVAAAFCPGRVILAHAGDSRCYRLRAGALEQLTMDHSYVAELLRSKMLSPEEAKHHPLANVISRSVGPCERMEPEIQILPSMPGDRYILCTDGLSNQVDDKSLLKILQEAPTPRVAVRNLIYNALRNGGDDNVTVLCAAI